MRALLLIGAVCCATAADAEELSGEAIFVWLARGETVAFDDSARYFVGALRGRQWFAGGAGALHNAIVACPGYAETALSSGYCTATATDGDQLILKWSCVSTAPQGMELSRCAGETVVIGGTGKFASAIGSSGMVTHLVTVRPDGRRLGYSEFTDYWLRY